MTAVARRADESPNPVAIIPAPLAISASTAFLPIAGATPIKAKNDLLFILRYRTAFRTVHTCACRNAKAPASYCRGSRENPNRYKATSHIRPSLKNETEPRTISTRGSSLFRLVHIASQFEASKSCGGRAGHVISVYPTAYR